MPALDLSEYLSIWSRSHGVRPHGLVAFWLTQMHRVATPLARRGVSPDVLSVSGVLLCALAAGAVWSSVPGALSWAAILIGFAGLADGVDGAVAVLQRRESPHGSVLDAICDRLSDLILVCTLWLAGAPASLCVSLGILFMLHEYLRALARAAGLRDDTVVTVAERPTRVIVAGLFLLVGGTAGGWTAGPADVASFWPSAGAWCGLVLSVAGMTQLVIWLRRTLT